MILNFMKRAFQTSVYYLDLLIDMVCDYVYNVKNEAIQPDVRSNNAVAVDEHIMINNELSRKDFNSTTTLATSVPPRIEISLVSNEQTPQFEFPTSKKEIGRNGGRAEREHEEVLTAGPYLQTSRQGLLEDPGDKFQSKQTWNIADLISSEVAEPAVSLAQTQFQSTPNSTCCFQLLYTILEDVGLCKYIELFKKHEIDVCVFTSLTETDLIEIGVTTIGARRKMLLVIEDLKACKNLTSFPVMPITRWWDCLLNWQFSNTLD